MAETIERSVDVHAPWDRVWPLVVEPGWWLAEAGQASAVEVVQLIPHAYASFRWTDRPHGRHPEVSTLVEFTLEPLGDVVRVSVVESGLDELTARRLEDDSHGWDQMLAWLRRTLEA